MRSRVSAYRPECGLIADATGLSLLVSPRWGGPVEGTQAMLSPGVSGLYHRSMEHQRRRSSLHTELSYGFATPEIGGVTTPFAEFDVTDGVGYRAKVGARFHPLSGTDKLKFELSSDLTTMPVNGISTLDTGTSPVARSMADCRIAGVFQPRVRITVVAVWTVSWPRRTVLKSTSSRS